MPLLTGSIEADVPVSFADREWREFIGRSVYDRFPKGYEDLRSSLADLDADGWIDIYVACDSNCTKASSWTNVQLTNSGNEPDTRNFFATEPQVRLAERLIAGYGPLPGEVAERLAAERRTIERLQSEVGDIGGLLDRQQQAANVEGLYGR